MSNLPFLPGPLGLLLVIGWPVPILLGGLRRLTDDHHPSAAWNWMALLIGWWTFGA